MSEIGKLLRLMVQGDKEFVVTQQDIFGTPAKFESQLSGGHLRKILAAYNNSDLASGEVVWGGDDIGAANGMPIPKGAIVQIPISSKLSDGGETGGVDVYFANTASGERSDLRILEIS